MDKLSFIRLRAFLLFYMNFGRLEAFFDEF